MSETISLPDTENPEFFRGFAAMQDTIVNDGRESDGESMDTQETRHATSHLATCMNLHPCHGEALEQWLVDDGGRGKDVLEGVLDVVRPLVRDKLEGWVCTQEEKIYGAPHAMLDRLLEYRFVDKSTLGETLQALRLEFGDDVREREVAHIQLEGIWLLGKAAVERRQVSKRINREVQSERQGIGAGSTPEDPIFTDAAQEQQEGRPESVNESERDAVECGTADQDDTAVSNVAKAEPAENITPQGDPPPPDGHARGRVIKSPGLRARERPGSPNDGIDAGSCNGSRPGNVDPGLINGANRMEWATQAACRSAEPGTFYPEEGGSIREAKRICAQCDVRSKCLEFALENDERFGVWGGLSVRERRKIKRM